MSWKMIPWCTLALYVLLAILVVYYLYLLFAKLQGEGHFTFDVSKRSPLKVVRGSVHGVELSCQLPFSNDGKQFGALIDVFTRHYLPREQYDALEIDTDIYRVSDPRTEKYWDAKIFYVGEGEDVVINIRLVAKSGDIVTALAEMPDLPLDIFQKTCSRSDYYYERTYLTFSGDEIRAAVKEALDEAPTEEVTENE
ncbi:MAG: hypothetical protein WCV63_06240 [Negativicutes bacterium]|jgi:hypothetical protein